MRSKHFVRRELSHPDLGLSNRPHHSVLRKTAEGCPRMKKNAPKSLGLRKDRYEFDLFGKDLRTLPANTIATHKDEIAISRYLYTIIGVGSLNGHSTVHSA